MCNKCVYKKREFPRDKENSGSWCIVCDRKFYVYELYKKYRKEDKLLDEETSKVEESIENLEIQFKRYLLYSKKLVLRKSTTVSKNTTKSKLPSKNLPTSTTRASYKCPYSYEETIQNR